MTDESPDRKATWTATTGVAVVALTAAVPGRRCAPAVRQGMSSGLRSAPAASGSVNGSHATGSPASGEAGTGRPDRRPHGDDAEAVAVIRQLDAASPDGRASRMEIQKRLGCGGLKAARLADLARGSEILASG